MTRGLIINHTSNLTGSQKETTFTWPYATGTLQHTYLLSVRILQNSPPSFLPDAAAITLTGILLLVTNRQHLQKTKTTTTNCAKYLLPF